MNINKKISPFLFLFSFCLNAQNDTLLYNGFDYYKNSSTDGLIDYEETNNLNISFQGWEIYSDNFAPLNPYLANSLKDSEYYDEQIFRNWHVAKYTLQTDTISDGDSTIYEITLVHGLRSFSWVAPPDSVLNILLSPNVWIAGDSSVLRWKSMPMQGPRHQDGYQVYIIEGGGKQAVTLPLGNIEPDFVMKRMSVLNGYPDTTNNSFAYIEKNFGFYPENGVMHTNYIPRQLDSDGEVDSAYQHVFMQEFEINLSHIRDKYIQVAFVHNSYDNYGIILDDILILGSGALGNEEIKNNKVRLSPNPSINHLEIELGSDVPLIVDIFDISGKFIESIRLKGSNQIDVSKYRPGYYLIKVTGQKDYYSATFIKKN